MALNLSIALSAEADLFISALAVELHSLNSGLMSYLTTYWYSDALAIDQMNAPQVSRQGTLTCSSYSTREDNAYFDTLVFDNVSAPQVIIPLSHLQSAENFIVVKACIFTESGAYPHQTIQHLNNSSGQSTEGIVLGGVTVPSPYTSAAGVAPVTVGTFGMVDDWKSVNSSPSGIMAWYFPVNPNATITSQSSLSLIVSAKVLTFTPS